MSRLIYVVLFVGLVPLAAWADTNDVCHVGAAPSPPGRSV